LSNIDSQIIKLSLSNVICFGGTIHFGVHLCINSNVKNLCISTTQETYALILGMVGFYFKLVANKLCHQCHYLKSP
jgi:hypothetical protein